MQDQEAEAVVKGSEPEIDNMVTTMGLTVDPQEREADAHFTEREGKRGKEPMM